MAGRGEGLRTYATCIRLLTRVRPHVYLQVAVDCKAFAAMIAYERLLARVPLSMHFELRRLREGAIAKRANVRSCVDGSLTNG